MIKQLKKSDVSLSPFVTTKAWNLFNIENDDTVLLEPRLGGIPTSDTNVSLDYVDYSGTPALNRGCNIALEEQDVDQTILEEGVSGSGYFTPSSEEQNPDGSYKRLVYTQINRAFYNTYRNPLQIFGMENIDFPKSKINRYITNEFIVFTVPQNIFGDRLLEKSIYLYDTLFNDNLVIYDDGNGNLLAGSNLFSKVQEVRTLGNQINDGNSSYICPAYSLTWDNWSPLWETIITNWETTS